MVVRRERRKKVCACVALDALLSGRSSAALDGGYNMRLGAIRLPALSLSAALLVAGGVPLVFAAHLHPTVLFAVLAYLGWGVVAVLSSAHFADQHLVLVLSAAFILNLVIFFAPVGLIWLSTRSRPESTRTAMLCIWAFTYLALLYFAFPAPASAGAAV